MNGILYNVIIGSDIFEDIADAICVNGLSDEELKALIYMMLPKGIGVFIRSIENA